MSSVPYISLCIVLNWIFYCVNGLSVTVKCKEECNSTSKFSSDESNLFCNEFCKVQQCQDGCSKYQAALTTSCQQTCGESAIERQFCTQGCGIALEIYASEVLGPETIKSLPAPELKKGSKSYSSVVLFWSGPIHENVTYYIQHRILEINSDWQVYNKSSLGPDGDVNITGLQPYVTYKFKIFLVITSKHVQTTPESEAITTLPNGAPSSSPTITDVSAPTPSVISISWKPPVFSNGQILGYRLKLNPYDHPELRPVNKEVPGNITSWTLRQLQSSQLYLITVSAWNKDGEGPVDSANITTPNPGNLPSEEMPYLVLGEENKVLKQNMEDWYSTPGYLHTENPPSIFITGVGVNIRRDLLLVSDSSGKVHQVHLNDQSKNKRNIYPSLQSPTAVTVDWLNNHAYVVDGRNIHRCSADGGSCISAAGPLESTARDIKVDPINGFLYFTQAGNNSGLYRLDIGDVSPNHTALPELITKCSLQSFFMDHGNMQLYFPNETQNTMLSSFLDGTGLVDLRSNKVVRPNFRNVSSVVFFKGLFFWTDGKKVYKEDYDKKIGTFYHNSLLFFANHYTSFNIYQPKVQPDPVPHSPPQNVQALFTSNKISIKWQKPQKLSYQGHGAWDKWWYDVSVSEKDGKKAVMSQNITTTSLEKTGLLPDTVYHIKVQACSLVGCGPWSNHFVGRTLPIDASSATILLGYFRRETRIMRFVEVNMYGEKVIESRPFRADSAVTDLTWNDDSVIFITDSNRIYNYNRATKRGRLSRHFLREKASSLTYDWLGKKLYWSLSSGVIRRANLDASGVEFVSQGKGLALHMALDSLSGRLYWNTMYSVESSYLNGDDHQIYFSIPYFTGKHVISLTLNFDLGKVLWYVKGFEDQELYMSDIFKTGMTWADITVTHLGSFKSISKWSSLQYFSHRLLWKDDSDAVMVGDLKCNHTSTVTGPRVSVFSVIHSSIQPYPQNLDKTSVIVIPTNIEEESVGCHGHWTLFNVTWKPSTVNYGKVFYEVSVKIMDGVEAKLQKTDKTWYEVSDVPPYSQLTVSLRAYTYWGYGPVTTVQVYSPMSVPSKPQKPRVYVTQYKDTLTSQHSMIADFRWSKPEVLNGIINHYNIYHWATDVVGGQVVTETRAATAGHFFLPKLMQNATYYFQVSACTEVGCGEKSDIVTAQANLVKPVPMLLIATNNAIVMTEVDSVTNDNEAVKSDIFPVSLAYLTQDDRKFWIAKDNTVVQLKDTTTTELVQLNGTGVDLALDWISHTLFIVQFNPTHSTSTIGAYLLDQNTYVELQTRPQGLGSIAADPYTSMVIWSEAVLGGGHYILYRMNTNQDISVVFDSGRSRRDTSRNCNCPLSMYVGPHIAVDHSQENKMEIVMYDLTSKYIMAADIDGCFCRNIISADKVSSTGDGPDQLSVDHLHVYWYSESEQRLYSIQKDTSKVVSKTMTNVKDMVAYGSQLQPLPGINCMDPGVYNGSIVMVKNSNSSVTLLLEEMLWSKECAGLSHPDTKYTVYYKQGTPGDRCGIDGSDCRSQSSYERQMTLTGLQPYSEYVVHGTVNNYYTEDLFQTLGNPHIVRTKVGVPSPVTSLNVTVLRPDSIQVTWYTPARPHGPLSEVSYKVKWFVEGQSNERIPDIILSNNSYIHSVVLKDLKPNQLYKIQVLASNHEKVHYSESKIVERRTFQLPKDIHLLDKSSDSLSISWTSPSDNSVVRHTFRYAKVVDGKTLEWNQKKDFLSILRQKQTKNHTQYNITFTKLEPYTDYRVMLIVNFKSRVAYNVTRNFVYKTVATVPAEPVPPEVNSLKTQGYEIVWTKPVVNGILIDQYLLQYRAKDSVSWENAFNGSDLRWMVDSDIIEPGDDYYFRVKARNEIGWGPFSNDSLLFTLRESKAAEDNIAVIAVSLSFVFILIVAIIVFVCYLKRCRQNEKRKPTHFVAVARGPDMELATLRDLPHTAFQQSNTLYAVSIIPTDSDIASLPHFRRDQLMLTKFLGSGAFGEVFEGVAKNILSDSSGETKVAVKTLRKCASDHEKEEFLKEAVLMSNFKHEHILSLLGVCLDNDPQFIILELMEGGDLLSFLRACRPSTTNAAFLCLTDLVKICVHVARGCKYLEEMHFVHRDLAARNCLVSSKTPADMQVKIGDFGLARDIYKNDYYRKEGEGLLPVRWMSPEALVDGVFTTQSDIWAFGVLIWEVMTFGRQPYPARTNIEVLHFVRSGGQLEQPEGCPEDMFELMQSCWCDAEARPSFLLVLQQLELFLEKCNALFADYIVPIRSRHIQPEVDGSIPQHRTRERKAANQRTSSLGHDPDPKKEEEVLYKKIHHATSFDSPEPRSELTCQIAMQNSMSADYLIPHTQGTPNYLEIIQDPVDRRQDFNERRLRKSSQGSSRHSSCSSDIYSHPLNSSLQVALPPLKQYESIHSIDSECQNNPYTMVRSIPEGYEIVPYPSHLNKGKQTVPEGYSVLKGPPRQVKNTNIHEGYDIVKCQPKCVNTNTVIPPGGDIPYKHPRGSSSSAEVMLDYPRTTVERGYSSAEARFHFTQAEAMNNMKNKKHFYPLADSRNYVDCNRNKALSSECSVAHISQNMDLDGQIMYWAGTNGSRHAVYPQDYTRHMGRSRGQVYPVTEPVVAGFPDVHASLV